MTFLSTFPCATIAAKAVLSFGLLLSGGVSAQNSDMEQLAVAREAIAKQDWRTAETLLVPLAQKQSQSQNPFVFYELAQVYENTRRPDAAKKIYQELTTSPDLAQRQPTIVVRAPYASRLLSLISLSQTKLNAIEARQSASLITAAPPAAVAAAVAPPPPVPRPASATAAPAPALVEPATPVVNISAGVTAAMKTWADAWAKKDMSAYYASYASDFKGDFSSQDAWRKQRQTNITTAQTISLEFKNVAMTTLSATQVQIRFLQIYKSNRLAEKTTKTLTLGLKNGRWLIEGETTK